MTHIADIRKKLPKGSDEVMKLKKMIGECKGGNFNTPALNEIKQQLLIKQWGKNNELGSWKEVLDRHGPAVAYAALRQGTLPYVPHSLLLPGHGVKWPESHGFLM